MVFVDEVAFVIGGGAAGAGLDGFVELLGVGDWVLVFFAGGGREGGEGGERDGSVVGGVGIGVPAAVGLMAFVDECEGFFDGGFVGGVAGLEEAFKDERGDAGAGLGGSTSRRWVLLGEEEVEGLFSVSVCGRGVRSAAKSGSG